VAAVVVAATGAVVVAGDGVSGAASAATAAAEEEEEGGSELIGSKAAARGAIVDAVVVGVVVAVAVVAVDDVVAGAGVVDVDVAVDEGAVGIFMLIMLEMISASFGFTILGGAGREETGGTTATPDEYDAWNFEMSSPRSFISFSRRILSSTLFAIVISVGVRLRTFAPFVPVAPLTKLVLIKGSCPSAL
jgi:hypothetical protein